MRFACLLLFYLSNGGKRASEASSYSHTGAFAQLPFWKHLFLFVILNYIMASNPIFVNNYFCYKGIEI